MRISNEFKIGFTVVVGLLALVFGLFFLKGVNFFKESKTFYVVYDRIEGLSASDPVTVSEFSVGQVKSIQLHPDNSGMILVELYVEPGGYFLSKDTKARLYSRDFLGSMAIELERGINPDPLISGDTLISEKEESLQQAIDKRIQPLEKKTKDLIGKLDTLVLSVNAIFNEATVNNLRQGMQRINQATKSFRGAARNLDSLVASSRENVDTILSSFRHFAVTLRDKDQELRNLIGNLSTISDTLAGKNGLASTLHHSNEVIGRVSNILTKIDNGEGSIGMLLNSTEMHDEMVESINALQFLLEDMQVNPDRYLHFFNLRKQKGMKLTPEEERNLKKILGDTTLTN